MTSNSYHIPVLLHAAISGLNIQPTGIYVDATFGGGGHSREILKHLNGGKLFGFDQDPDAQANVPEDDQFTFVEQNFRYMTNFLRFYGINKVDGILADLGVSSHQFDKAERGFSLRFDAELDMRMNPQAVLSAHTVVNEYEEARLTQVLRTYGEVDHPHRLSRKIIQSRQDQPIKTTGQLINLIDQVFPPHKRKQNYPKVFQAIRIEVNQELEVLKELLLSTTDLIKPGGRLVVISYHSLEDRLVKNFFRTGNLEGKQEKDFYGNLITPWKEITRKPMIPDEDEIQSNPRARSAKLRIAERKE